MAFCVEKPFFGQYPAMSAKTQKKHKSYNYPWIGNVTYHYWSHRLVHLRYYLVILRILAFFSSSFSRENTSSLASELPQFHRVGYIHQKQFPHENGQQVGREKVVKSFNQTQIPRNHHFIRVRPLVVTWCDRTCLYFEDLDPKATVSATDGQWIWHLSTTRTTRTILSFRIGENEVSRLLMTAHH